MPHFDKLTIAADVIERAHIKYEFDLNEWGCGSVACAVGIIVAERTFPELYSHASLHYPRLKSAPNMSGWDVIMGLFDIDYVTARKFFNISSYPTDLKQGPEAAAEVVRRIREYVRIESKARAVCEIIEQHKILEPA